MSIRIRATGVHVVETCGSPGFPGQCHEGLIPQLVVASWSTSWESAGALACGSSAASTSEN